MSWLNLETSFYKCPADNTGRIATFRSVLFTHFATTHEWFFKDHRTNSWLSGESNDLASIIDLRRETLTQEEKTLLKQTLQCYTPGGVFETKKKSDLKEISKTGVIQFDFDYQDNSEYDVEELKRCVFDLPFIAFCGLSCSGKGFYALGLISDPHKLQQYAEHCFKVFDTYGIKPDTTKGRNSNDLRYVSYDCNMLIKANPEPLTIKRFHEKKSVQTKAEPIQYKAGLLNNLVHQISTATKGHRWETVQRISFTAGGTNDSNWLDQIKALITTNPAFTGEEAKYFECAEDCFNAGKLKPLKIHV